MHTVWGEWRQEQYETTNKENHILKQKKENERGDGLYNIREQR